jgi:chorismate--pyruvate lyase
MMAIIMILVMLITGSCVYNDETRLQMIKDKFEQSEQIVTLEAADLDSCRHNETEKVCDLLYSDQSTTAYFKKICPTGFNVVVLNQAWCHLKPNEQHYLGGATDDLVFEREVLLRCHQRVLMVARSVFPKDVLAGKGEVFEHLGNRPLGEVLYQDPNLKRELLDIQAIDQHTSDYQQVAEHMSHQPQKLWTRTTRIVYFGKPILLYEIFMPALIEPLRETLNHA